MEINTENAGPYTSVRLDGRLDSKGAGSIYDAIIGLGSLGPGKVIVNMAAVTHATRAGSGALIVAAKMLRVRTGEKLLIYNASPQVAALIDGSGHNHLIEVHSSSNVQTHGVTQLNETGVI
ncbi:STAS domain-containing protein [Roseibium sp. MMSF_3544]|uniref:STAS domain-containing protein n=1 Tax=unclassified Roseibium TaxID=2629323 RepID=UPI00273FC8A8|nr:STAS domain-containing protein [Roseibium sp. MMSF_3544]